MKLSKWLITIFILIAVSIFYSRCIDAWKPDTADARGAMYAGANACKDCHTDIHSSFMETGHAKTSWPVTSLPPGAYRDSSGFNFNKHTTVRIEKRDTGIFQVAYIDGKDSIAKRFDIAFGSGAHAHSFGYWQNSRLFQLPLSYFTSIQSWANSPGFPSQEPYYQRPIVRGCFECHSSFVEEKFENLESISQVRTLEKNSIIYGIDCERCHGPALKHVVFHKENKSKKVAKYIRSWNSLSREQKLDICGICHSGNDRTSHRSTFSFSPGDTLSDYYFPETPGSRPPPPDVHGNQAALLASSACFQKSKTMDCASCHNIHQSKAISIASYSKQCQGCHKNVAHRDAAVKASLANAVNNCVDCHMPREASKLISFQVAGRQQAESYLLRTHRIAVYPAATQKMLQK